MSSEEDAAPETTGVKLVASEASASPDLLCLSGLKQGQIDMQEAMPNPLPNSDQHLCATLSRRLIVFLCGYPLSGVK